MSKGPGRPKLDSADDIKRSISGKLLRIAGSGGKGEMAAIRTLIDLHNLSGVAEEGVFTPKDHAEMKSTLIRILQSAGRELSLEAISEAFTEYDTLPPEAIHAEVAQDVAGAATG